MTDNNPITPPPELVQQWLTAPEYAGEMVSMTERRLQEIADKAALRGADRRLEQCVDWVNKYESDWLNGYEREGPAAEQMRNAFRPQPPSLKEQALETLRSMRIAPVVINGINVNAGVMNKYEIIRRAIESMPD